MKLSTWLLGFTTVALSTLSLTQAIASERETAYYRIDTRGPEFVDKSPYILAVRSADLARYPKAVVTFTVTTEFGRAPSAIAPPETKPERIFGRRHYRMIAKDEFGRAGIPEVVFDRGAGTVYIGFIGREGKTFYYKEVNSAVADSARHQMRQLGKLDSP